MCHHCPNSDVGRHTFEFNVKANYAYTKIRLAWCLTFTLEVQGSKEKYLLNHLCRGMLPAVFKIAQFTAKFPDFIFLTSYRETAFPLNVAGT